MNEHDQEKKREATLLKDFMETPTFWEVPRCCKENWDDCPHKVKRPEKAKRNIAI